MLSSLPAFMPCDPVSELLESVSSSDLGLTQPSLQFCAKWNPDFPFNGRQCCSKMSFVRHRRRLVRGACPKERSRAGYCSEVTPEQKEYTQAIQEGKVPDVLKYLTQALGTRGDQAYCSVNNGFLANGLPVVPTPVNGIIIKSPERCLNFGTDAMVAMLEWLGREVKTLFSGANLILGDISGPKGGCLYGRSGRRGHASHTSGQDADVGFVSVHSNRKEVSHHFERHFDPAANLAFLKRIAKNPFACIKVMFLDRSLIAKLRRYAHQHKDAQWKSELERFVRHMPGHKNHLHIRIGKGPGVLGCGPNARPELEFEEDGDSSDDVESSIRAQLVELQTR